MSQPKVPLPFDDVFTSADLPRFGVGRGALQGWRARNEVVELCSGVFAPAGTSSLDDKRLIYASRAIAVGLRPVTIAGAAVLHGLPTPTVPHASWHRDDRHVRIPSRHLLQVQGLLVPSLGWTAVALARWQSLEAALVPLDVAVGRRGGREQVTLCAEHVGRAPGTRHVGRALAVADARAESPLESISRGLMIDAGLPVPDLQTDIRTDRGRFRVDFCWPDQRVVGEADGRVKYVEPDALWKEKNRQEALERCGYKVVRWSWQDVTTGRIAWLGRLRRALHEGASNR